MFLHLDDGIMELQCFITVIHQAKKRVFLYTIICTTNGSTNFSKQKYQSCVAEANLAEGIDKTITKSLNISLVDNLKMGQRNS